MTLMHVPVIDIAPYRSGDRAAAVNFSNHRS